MYCVFWIAYVPNKCSTMEKGKNRFGDKISRFYSLEDRRLALDDKSNMAEKPYIEYF